MNEKVNANQWHETMTRQLDPEEGECADSDAALVAIRSNVDRSSKQ